MTEKSTGKWRTILGNVPSTGPRQDSDGNVHPLPVSLDKIENEIRDATNTLVRLETEAAKIEADKAKRGAVTHQLSGRRKPATAIESIVG